MNNWFKRHERIITIIVIAGFLAGIVWWSVATYVTSRNPAVNPQASIIPRKEDSVLVITKEGIDLEYPYWIMKNEVDSITQQQAQIYQQYYGQQLDPLFDYLVINNQIVDLLYNEKIVRYYAEQNDLLPSKEEINSQINALVDLYISQYKADTNNWNNMVQYYGSEQNIRNILISGLQEDVENSLITNNVKKEVANVSREEALTYIRENFESIKSNYEEVRVQHILLSDEATANSIKEKITDEELTFEDAVAIYSEDTLTATSSGDIGWIKRGQYDQNLEEAAFNAEIGAILGPISTYQGYQIIRVVDKKIFKNPEDIFLYDEVYSEIQNTIQEEKYNNWLVSYIRSGDFGRNYYDTKLMYMHQLTEAGTNTEKLENLVKEIENIIFEGTEISVEADSDDLAIYTLAVNQLMNAFNDQYTSINEYLSLSALVDPETVSLGLEEIGERIDELNIQKTTEESTVLNNLLSNYEDAQNFLISKNKIETLGISTADEASSMMVELEGKMEDYINKLEKVLADLFKLYPSSNSVVQMYYQLNPQDPEVRVSYSKLQLSQIKQYSSYLGSQYLFSFFQQPITEILVNVQGVVDSTQAATDTKLEALDIGLELAELVGLREIKLFFLETVKELDPNYYINIDQMIEDTKKIIEESSNPVTQTSEPSAEDSFIGIE
jgi:parvulin-like peptidyl-prolyl isomerase